MKKKNFPQYDSPHARTISTGSITTIRLSFAYTDIIFHKNCDDMEKGHVNVSWRVTVYFYYESELVGH